MAQRTPVLSLVRTERGRAYVTVWLVVLLMSGQGFRYLMGLPAYILLTVLTVVAVALIFRPRLETLKPPLLVGMFIVLAAVSTLWSATRAVTALAVLALIATTFVAMVTVRGANPVQFMVLLYRGLQISLFLGVAFELFVSLVIRHPIGPLVNDLRAIAGDHPNAAAEEWSDNLLFHGGPIQGFVGNRNPFGAIALFTAVAAMILLMERRLRRADGLFTIVIAVAVLLLTMSATVTVAAAYIVVLTVAALAIRAVPAPLKRALSFTVLTCTAIAAVLTIKYRDQIFALLDRGSDATHRTEIWNEVIHYAWQRPEGWGFVGYWPTWTEPYSSIVDNVGVLAAHAHNAFLDSWLQLGLIGLALLLAMVLLLFGSAWRLVERANWGDTYIPLGWALLTAGLVLQALTESRLLVEGGWFLLVALYCSGPPVFKLTIVDPSLVHTGNPQTIE